LVSLVRRPGRAVKSLAWSAAETADLLRIDIPKADVKPENRRAAGVSYLDIDGEIEWTEMKPVLAVPKRRSRMRKNKKSN
jgi:hypothetical protein